MHPSGCRRRQRPRDRSRRRGGDGVQEWPGNVRELKNTLWRAALLSEGAPIEARHLGLPVRGAVPPAGPLSLEQAEWRAIGEALRSTDGNKAQAAKVLGIARSTLLEKLKRPAAK